MAVYVYVVSPTLDVYEKIDDAMNDCDKLIAADMIAGDSLRDVPGWNVAHNEAGTVPVAAERHYWNRTGQWTRVTIKRRLVK